VFGSTIDFSSEKTRRNSIIQQGKFMNIENKIREINDLITNHILRVVDGKEIVLIDLSGGHDKEKIRTLHILMVEKTKYNLLLSSLLLLGIGIGFILGVCF